MKDELVAEVMRQIAEREYVVFGKGDKEQGVYFGARAKLHLQEYLNSRTDDNPALFVTLRSPHERMRIGGIKHRLREMGKRLNIPKVHPHKFRRTLATMAIEKGMPIEQLQRLLGHQRLTARIICILIFASQIYGMMVHSIWLKTWGNTCLFCYQLKGDDRFA